jgi:hypothetical protein
LFAIGVFYTGGKLAAGVVDTGGNLPPVLLKQVANLPLGINNTRKTGGRICCRCCLNWWQICRDVIDTSGAP